MFPANCHALFGRHAGNRRLDLIEQPDSAYRFFGDRRLGRFILVVEMLPGVCSAHRLDDAGRSETRRSRHEIEYCSVAPPTSRGYPPRQSCLTIL